jgi:2-hydroxychromene-2-carboxylate isomerase
MQPIIRFYFSFRSPYAWFAAERWHVALEGVNASVERIPFYPTPETFPNDPTQLPSKYRYVVQDVVRLAREYGLAIRPPAALDTDWARAHAAYLAIEAEQPERAEAFLLEMYRSWFTRCLDVALDPVISDAAERAGADAALACRGAASGALRARVAESFLRGQERDGIFGAPSFVCNGELYWGHDRMYQLRAALLASAASSAAEEVA